MLTDTVVEKGRSIAVEMIAKRFAEAGIRLSARERAAFAEALTGDRLVVRLPFAVPLAELLGRALCFAMSGFREDLVLSDEDRQAVLTPLAWTPLQCSPGRHFSQCREHAEFREHRNCGSEHTHV
jgi:hypothetical protein